MGLHLCRYKQHNCDWRDCDWNDGQPRFRFIRDEGFGWNITVRLFGYVWVADYMPEGEDD